MPLLLIFCGCATTQHATTLDNCANFKSRLSDNLNKANEYCRNNGKTSCDHFKSNLNILLHCKQQVELLGESDDLIIQSRKLTQELTDAEKNLAEIEAARIKQQTELEEERTKQHAKLEAERIKQQAAYEVQYKICKSEYLLIDEKVHNLFDKPNNTIKVKNYSGFEFPSQYFTAFIDRMHRTNDTCPIDKSNIVYSFDVSTKPVSADSEQVMFNSYLNHNGTEEYFHNEITFTDNYNNLSSQTQPFTVNLKSINYTLAEIPHYNNKDKYIEINNVGNSLVIQNKSDKFLTISEIWFYYNNYISKSIISDLSLPPESFKDNLHINISEQIKNKMYFPNITKAVALNTNLKIGFAVKYKVENSNVENTLYKIHTYKLVDIINLTIPK